jgi:prepilin-type N-terminal cleavage/methylation domain-containing protein
MRLHERGFTLIEVLIALAVFAIIIVGAIGVMGAVNASGLTEGLSTGLVTGRVSKDVTAASTYLQALQEYVAAKGSGSVIPDTYCAGTCGAETALPVDFPTPASQGLNQPYQLDWTNVVVLIEWWGWDAGTGQYAPSLGCSGDCLLRVESTVSWQLKGAPRSVRMERFIP